MAPLPGMRCDHLSAMSFILLPKHIVHYINEQKANYALLSPIQAAFVSEIVAVFGGVFCSKFLLEDKRSRHRSAFIFTIASIKCI